MPEPRKLILRERATTPNIELTAAELRVLREADAGLTLIAGARSGLYDVACGPLVGTIVGPDLHVVIQPKMTIRRLVYLLRYLPGGPEIGEAITLGVERDLLDAMQVVFLHALERALEGGLLHDYRNERDLLAMPRGRIDALHLVRKRFGLLPPLECEFQEYTPDIEVNRRLLAATRILGRCRTSNHEATARLRTMLERFEGVRLVEFDPRHLAPIQLDRRANRYGVAPSLADIVLSHASIELRQGHADAVGFLLNMDDLYERFVVEGLREALGLDRREWLHHAPGLTLDVAGNVEVEPDALWRSPEGEPLLVIDAKYKVTADGYNADVYQALAYCTALGVPCGILVYAHAGGAIHVVRHANVTLHVVPLDPDGEPGELKDRLAATAQHIAALALGAQGRSVDSSHAALAYRSGERVPSKRA